MQAETMQTKERLEVCGALLTAILMRRESSGDHGYMQAVERRIVDRELGELEQQERKVFATVAARIRQIMGGGGR